jgi:serine/threonine protein kinase
MSKPQDASEAIARVRRCIDRLKDSPEIPDYFVRPDAKRPGFFLPVNKFSIGLKQGDDMLDADCLEYVSQGHWFTVFRYTPKAASAAGPQDSIIIKHTPINNTTFKYLLQEKAMMHYLNDAETIAVERLDGGFSPLVLWRINPVKLQGSYQNDRFIAYQDGGRPLEVQFFIQKLQFEELDLLKIAQDLLKALIYLNRKRVVHRNLNLGTVVYSKQGGAKLIALGHAKYIDRPLPYEDRIRSFEVDVCGCESSLLDSSLQQSSSMLTAPVHASPMPPTTNTEPDDFVHPAAKGAR